MQVPIRAIGAVSVRWMLPPASVDDNLVTCHSAEHPCGGFRPTRAGPFNSGSVYDALQASRALRGADPELDEPLQLPPITLQVCLDTLHKFIDAPYWYDVVENVRHHAQGFPGPFTIDNEDG